VSWVGGGVGVEARFGSDVGADRVLVDVGDEGVELNSLFGSLFLKDVQEEGCVLFDLEEASAIGGDGCNEIGAEFLWSSWHGKEGPGLKPL